MAKSNDAAAEIEWIASSVLADPDRACDVQVFALDSRVGGRRARSHRGLAVERWHRQWRRHYRRWQQLRLDTPSPRVNSVVRRVFHGDLSEALAVVQKRSGRIVGLELHQPLTSADTQPVRRAAGQLCIPWSHPPVPVWLVVEPWWHEQAQVSLRLRTTRRWRYPIRYFATAHRVMDQLTAPIDSSFELDRPTSISIV